jgi:hypothetical protein
MTIQNFIPAVVYDPRGSISTERALNQIKDLLCMFPIEGNEDLVDRITASIDDVETMLANIQR